MTELPAGMTWERWEEYQRSLPVQNTDTEQTPDIQHIEEYQLYLWERGEYDG